MKTEITWKTEKRKVSELKSLEKNPRRISRAALEKMKDRIRKRGFHDVLKLDTKGTVLSGNVRKEALADLGIEEVNVLVPDRELTKEERDVVILESNRHDGDWDFDMLPEFGSESLLEAGFDSPEVDQIFEDDEDIEDDFDAEEEADKIKIPKSKPGDIYQLGEHRLMCGDSTSAEDVDRLMDGASADMVFSDPPYNMNYVSAEKGGIMNDNMGEEEFVAFCEGFMLNFKRALRPGGVFYICSGYQSYMPFVYAMKAANLDYAGPIVWVKNTLGMGMNDYRHKHEMILKGKSKKKKAQPILYGWNGGKHYFAGGHDEGDVWDVRKLGGSMVHPTQKPLALINKAIKNSSKHGDAVLDLFGGSGATLIAAEKTGRRAYVMELDPRYADVIVKRWEALTEEHATLIEHHD